MKEELVTRWELWEQTDKSEGATAYSWDTKKNLRLVAYIVGDTLYKLEDGFVAYKHQMSPEEAKHFVSKLTPIPVKQ